MNDHAPTEKEATPAALPESAKRRQTGRVPRLNTRMTAIMLEDDLIEWGKRQEGGLSATVRCLLRQAKESSTPH